MKQNNISKLKKLISLNNYAIYVHKKNYTYTLIAYKS